MGSLSRGTDRITVHLIAMKAAYLFRVLQSILLFVATHSALAQYEFRYASMSVKDAHYLNGDFKGLRGVLKNDQKVADVPAVRFGGEPKPQKPRDLVLILDELAELHTYLDPNQEQVVVLNRRIRALLKHDVEGVLPEYRSRHSYLSQVASDLAPDVALALNRADLLLIEERISRRERFFLEKLLSQSPLTTSASLSELIEVWKSAPSGLTARHRLAMTKHIVSAAITAGDNKNVAAIEQGINHLVVDGSLDVRERIEAHLLAAYLDALTGKPHQAVKRYLVASHLITAEVEGEQRKRKEQGERFADLAQRNRKYLEDEQSTKAIGLTILSLFASVALANSGAVKTVDGARNLGQQIGNINRGIGSAMASESFISTWQSTNLGSEMNREMATLRILHRYVDVPVILELIPALIHAHAAQGKHAEVLAMAEVYFRYADEIRGNTHDSRSREAFQERMGQVFRAASNAALVTGNASLLLDISERYSSHVLLDAIVSGRTRLEAGVEEAMVSRGDQSGGTRGQPRNLSDRGLASQSGRDALANFVALSNATTMSPQEISDYLGRHGMAMARLLETGNSFGILFASQNGVQLVSEQIPAADILSLKKDIERVMASPKTTRSDVAKAVNRSSAGRFMSKHLFSGTSRLVIIPSANLADFPFAAVTEPDAKAKSPRYLIEQRPVVRQVSISMLKAIAERRNQSGGSFTSLGNPLLINEYASADPLPGAERESREAAALMGGTSLVRKEATQEALLAALQNGHIVHVAAHGVFNAKDPTDSRLAIPSADGKKGGMSALRLFGQGINASTVFLSACSLGRNRVTLGNEVNGFIRPLLMQSVQNIVTNLWEVDDEGAHAVTLSILAQMKQGKEMPAAFQDGIKEVIAAGRFSSPYYWGPFALFASK